MCSMQNYAHTNILLLKDRLRQHILRCLNTKIYVHISHYNTTTAITTEEHCGRTAAQYSRDLYQILSKYNLTLPMLRVVSYQIPKYNFNFTTITYTYRHNVICARNGGHKLSVKTWVSGNDFLIYCDVQI